MEQERTFTNQSVFFNMEIKFYSNTSATQIFNRDVYIKVKRNDDIYTRKVH